MKKHLAVASLLLMGGLAAFADTTQNSFGTLSGATFGGSGIPNNAVQITTVGTTGGDTITLGLTATPRYQNPALGNNGAGTFYATAGANNGLETPPQSIGPTWNFDWYANLQDNSGTFYQYILTYTDTTTGKSGSFNFGAASDTSSTSQDSWNLGMGFLNTISFDPNAADDYTLNLRAVSAYGGTVASDSINVNVNRVPDAASTAGLLGFGFLGLLAFRRTQLRRATVKK